VTVYLVGAGPGDPGLLTVRAAEVLASAEVVVHDRLAEPSLLELAPPAAVRIDVGKTPGGPIDQAGINQLLVEHGRAGRTVVRLKGGDPFVFGRGGEEAMALIEAGLAFEVVPGITSAIAAPAYAGIPVTHRGLSTSFTVVTGHSRHSVDSEIDWMSLAQAGDTIIVLMGVSHRAEIARRLIEAGRPSTTPVACVRWGTRSDQRTIRTTLAGLGDAPLEAPVAIVIGQVAGLDLGWFERRPLFGRSVVVTRAREQSQGMVAALRAQGAQVVEVPTIAIAPTPDRGAELFQAMARLVGARAGWVVLTSTNAVDALFAVLHDTRDLGGVQVAAVGRATAAALRQRGVIPDLVPPKASSESLVAAFPPAPKGGGRVLLPQADRAGPELAHALVGLRWEVQVVKAYRTVAAEVPPDLLERALAADAICFTSGSTVESWVAAAGPVSPPVVATIGPMTTAAASASGLAVTAEAQEATFTGLVTALVSAFAARSAAADVTSSADADLAAALAAVTPLATSPALAEEPEAPDADGAPESEADADADADADALSDDAAPPRGSDPHASESA
jgi:uroporphyrinogen III methyltransferase/synthase